jgi:hypothetical protein
MSEQGTGNYSSIYNTDKFNIMEGYKVEVPYFFQPQPYQTSNTEGIYNCCCEPPPKKEYNATAKDNTILFLIIIFLMILCSRGLSNRNIGYTVCDGGYAW